MTPAELIVVVIGAYFAAGLLIGTISLARGTAWLDERLGQSPLSVRLILVPGAAATWPLIVHRALRHRQPQAETGS